MRFAALALVSACALAACNPSAPAGGAFPDLNGASYRAEATIQGPDGQALPLVMIRSGQRVRVEMDGPMGQMAMVNNGEGGENFVLVTNNGQTTAMQMSGVDYENPADKWNSDMASSATRTGDCSVAGENGAEWTREQNTVCVTNDGIILRATENGRTTWETTSVQRGPQSDDLFTMPAGVQALDMSAIAGAAAGVAANGGEATPELCNTLRNAGAPANALERAGC